jgi:hypothetical protein
MRALNDFRTDAGPPGGGCRTGWIAYRLGRMRCWKVNWPASMVPLAPRSETCCIETSALDEAYDL